MISKEKKEELFIENRYYIDYIVYSFLSEHPTYYYMKEDLQAECYLKFVELVDTFDGELSSFTTYLKTQLSGWLLVWIRTETISSIKAKRFREEYGDEEETYEDEENPFEKIITNAKLTDKQEHVLRLKFEDDLTESQIAETIGVTQQAVNRILLRSYARISKTYDP